MAEEFLFVFFPFAFKIALLDQHTFIHNTRVEGYFQFIA